MKKTRMGKKTKQGFTLVELIVVLVILAVLASLLIPALVGYIDKANEKKAIAECRQVVMAAQTIVSEQYGERGSTDTTILKKEILNLAEVNGTIKELKICSSNMKSQYVEGTVLSLTYETKDGISVLYKVDGTPKYVVGGKSEKVNAPGYIQDVNGFTEAELQAIKEKYMDKKFWEEPEATTKALQMYFREKYGGAFPPITQEEIDLLPGTRPESINKTVWKPYLTKEGNVMMVAANNSEIGNTNAMLIYYNGNYYYHQSAYNKNPVDAYISDQQTFGEADLTEAEFWIKIK
ncbi:MAG: type II secretion system protein [Lachnospiraceae bacterium]